MFRLHKTLDAEPMYNFVVMSDIHLSGPPLILNVEAGKVALQGDLAFSGSFGPQTNRNGSDFSVTVQGVNGAEFVPSDEEFMSLAPESGYQKSLTTVHNISNPNYRPGQHSQFYVKTASGKYASVEADITLRDRFQTANLVAIIYYNPSGSRNLEFDQKKWINRK